jgi:ATP-binding cassette subfamily B (MDR/TAP) protein 1
VIASFIISQVAPFLQLFATAAVSYGKVVETIDRPSRIDGTSDEGLVLPAVAGEIELRNVGFAYPSRADVPVIHDLSLVIPANKHTGIVGLSGSGKSTLAALIGRLYDPVSGEVLIDGHNLRDVNVRSIRRHIGTVAQNSSLFDRSVLENVAHGLINSPSAKHAQLQDALVDDSLVDFVTRVRSGKTLEEVLSDSSPETQQIYKLAVAAAEDANALRFIENFQYGFATSVGSTGSQLSGGQKQRVVLARALIRQPSILILDEATASLDSISERIVQEALERVTDSSRTTITIAHRLSTIKKADNIIVMRDGQIIEQGPHAELLAGDGPFATMVRLQNAGTVADDAVSSRNMSLDIASAEKSNAYGLSKDTLVELPLDESSEKPEESKLGRPHISNLAGVLIMGRPYIGFILLGVSASIIVGGSYSAEAVIFGQTVGELSACKDPSSISSKGAFFGLMFFVLAVIEFCANMISTASFGRVAEKMLTRVRILCLRFLFRQDIQWHEEEERTPAKLLAYISSDANAMAGLTGTILGVILAILINMIAGIVLAHIVAWKIAVVLLSMIPILLASGYLRLRIAASFHSRHQKAFASSVGLATEAVGSMTTIASYSLEDETLHVYERSLRGPYKATLKAIAHGNFWLAMAYSIGNLVYALAYWWGSRQIVAGLYSPTQFFTTLPALLFSAQSCGQLLSLAPDVSKATVSAGRVLALLQSKPSESGQSNFHKNPKNIGGSDDSDAEAGADVDDEKVGSNYLNAPRGATIHFKNVHFNYPSRPSIPVLQGLTLSIPANSFVALVGPSGAGKSTIISLLERFYYPSMGSVTIDARDIARAPASFRDVIALVPQHSALFEGTLRFNLEIGARPDTIPSMADIEAACRLAHIHDTIMALPLGYETPCGPRGNQFSGGQMQRLAIARALVRKPRLLLLDESTSALDAESEAGLQAALEGATRAVTVVAVAHRMRTVRGADCIFVIDGGVVVEGGRHEELVGRSAAYREMVVHQTLGL